MDDVKAVELAVVGGGPAGMAAAVEAARAGIRDILILEREKELGGILQQCIHNGFGLHVFREELTGPEYVERFIRQVKEYGIDYRLNTMVIDITPDKILRCINPVDGLLEIKAKAVILAMGCRERTRGALNIPGTRPAGILTAGTAQRFVNIDGYMPGKRIVILGSGDIGLIMARRMTLEGAKVEMVCEIMPYSSGLTRNIAQCLNDYNIPLLLSHTVTQIHGKNRVEGVTVSKVDAERKPIPGTERYVECDTVLLSVGLIPENELSREAGIVLDPVTSGPVVNESMETSVEGVFACGNVLHVHDLVDYVTEEAQLAGRSAARYILDGLLAGENGDMITLKAGKGVRYTVPQNINRNEVSAGTRILFRVDNIYENPAIKLFGGNEEMYSVRKTRVAPGEMQRIVLNKVLVDKIRNVGELTVQIESGDV